MEQLPTHQQIDLSDPGPVIATLDAGAEANMNAACRRGAIDLITHGHAHPRLIATGDLHDNPVHFIKLVDAAGLHEHADRPPAHLTLHEIIHGEALTMGMDFSYRALTRVAALKAAYPELVHCLLANHEIAQLLGSAILKNGVRCVDAFDEALEHAFPHDAREVEQAIRRFIRSMPLALRVRTANRGDILCAHSLPGPAAMGKFDATVLTRELTESDYVPRQGAAHLMVWGRGYDHDQLEDLVERWGVNAFILGHEHAEHGSRLVEPNALILNSDHARGVYLPIDLNDAPPIEQLAMHVLPLAG